MAALFPSLFKPGATQLSRGNPDTGLRENFNRTLGPAFPPTAIQLCSSKFIHFASNAVFPTWRTASHRASTSTNDGPNLAPRSFEILSYQSVHVTDIQQPLLEKKLDNQQSQPNMGIWNCHIPENKDTHVSLASSALNGALFSDSRIPTFLLTIDTVDPSAVYPTVTCMIQTILRHFDKRDSYISNTGTTNPTSRYHPSLRTTSISTIASTDFGQASQASRNLSSTLNKNVSFPDDSIRLVLCAVVPPNSSTMKHNFKEKQAHRLVHYHLHRFAHALNCTLLFLQDTDIPSASSQASVGSSKGMAVGTSEEDDSSRKTADSAVSASSSHTLIGLSVNELALILKTIVNVEDQDDSTFVDNSIDPSTLLDTTGTYSSPTLWLRQQGFIEMEQTSIFLPDSHDADLIESVMVRNASCSGLWDAYKDSLGVALKPATSTESVTLMQVDKTNSNADQEWLNKLSDALSRVAYQTGDGRTVVSDSASVSGTEPTTPVAGDGHTRITDGSSTHKRGKSDFTPNKKKMDTPSKSKVGQEGLGDFFEDLLKM